MFKKFIVTASIVCVVIGTLSSLVFADYGIRGHGIDSVYNGSSWGEKAWVTVGTLGSTYEHHVDVWVKKGSSSVRYGEMKYIAPANSQYHTYYSAFVDGTGGTDKHAIYT